MINRIKFYLSYTLIFTLTFSITFSRNAWAESRAEPTGVPTALPSALSSESGNHHCTGDQSTTETKLSDMSCKTVCCAYSQKKSCSSTATEGETSSLTNQAKQCVNGYQFSVPQIGPHCEALALNTMAEEKQKAAMIAYSAAAAVCLASCIAGVASAGVTSITKVADAACTVAGLGADAVDIIGMVQVSNAGAEAIVDTGEAQNTPVLDWWEQSAGASAAGPAGTAASVGRGVYSSNKMQTALFKKRMAKAAKKAATGQAEKAAKAASASKALKNVSACLPFALYTTGAVFKGLSYKGTVDGKKKECETIEASAKSNFGISLGTPPPPNRFDPPRGGANSTELDVNGTKLTGEDNTQAIADATDFFNGGNSGAATDDPIGAALNTNPNKSLFPEALKNLGADLNTFANDVVATSPATAIGNLPGIPEDFKDSLKEFEQLAKDGRIQGLGDGLNSSYSAAGRGVGSAGTESGGLFGIRKLGGPGLTAPGSKEFALGKQNTAPKLISGDIWHTGWTGTIFQIVTQKMGQTQNRIDRVEWSTPLNRAQHGLPNVNLKGGK